MSWSVQIGPGCMREARWRDRIEIFFDLPKGSIGLELGVECAERSLRMLNIVQPCELSLVDPWTEYPGMKRTQQNHDLVLECVKEWLRPEIEAGIVRIHRCTSKEACDRFPDGVLDWIAVDADHCYDAASWDIQHYWEKLRVGGWMIIHDYIIHDKNGRNFGAKRATDEFLRDHQEAKVVGYARGMTPWRVFPTIVLEKA